MPPGLVIQTDQIDELLTNSKVIPIFVGSDTAFVAGHIPGSIHIAPAELVCGEPPAAGKIPREEQLAALLNRLGLQPDNIIIAYDDEGGGWAGRLIWTLDIIGHRQYHYLDGGLVAWLGEQRKTESGIAATKSNEALGNSPYTVHFDREKLVSAEHIMNHLGTANFAIWDARSPEEHRGERVVAQRGGKIPGAVNIDWLELMDRNNHLRLKPLDAIKAMLDDRSLTLDKNIVTHCQSHHRSGLTYLVGKIIGLNIKAYDGSWSEWGNRDDTPIE